MVVIAFLFPYQYGFPCFCDRPPWHLGSDFSIAAEGDRKSSKTKVSVRRDRLFVFVWVLGLDNDLLYTSE